MDRGGYVPSLEHSDPPMAPPFNRKIRRGQIRLQLAGWLAVVPTCPPSHWPTDNRSINAWIRQCGALSMSGRIHPFMPYSSRLIQDAALTGIDNPLLPPTGNPIQPQPITKHRTEHHMRLRAGERRCKAAYIVRSSLLPSFLLVFFSSFSLLFLIYILYISESRPCCAHS